MKKWLGLVLVLLVGCGTTVSPLSLDANYSADAEKLAQAESLSKIHIGVARFTDTRPRRANDIHAASYVAHGELYDVGMTWNGRTFAPTAEVIQALLVSELRHAGLSADPIDAVVDAGDVLAARTAGEKASVDVVLSGAIRRFDYERSETKAATSVRLEVSAVDIKAGKVMLRSPFDESHRADTEASPQARVDELLGRSFKPVAHDVVGKLGEAVAALVAAAEQAAQLAQQQQQAAQAAVTETPEETHNEPTPPPHAHHHKGRHPSN